MPIGKLSVEGITQVAEQLARRLKSLESQFQDVPPSYTIAGGFLVEDTAVSATSVNLNTFPIWARNSQIYILIDAGTVQAEVRKITSISDTVASFSDALAYAHQARDPVFFLTEVDLSPFWFGAKGDGSTNDHDAFQAAINQMTSYGEGGGILRLPNATFYITGTLTFSDSTMSGSIIGAGIYNSKIIYNSSSGNTECIKILKDGCFLSDFSIEGSQVSQNMSSGVYVYNCDNITIARIGVYYASTSAIYTQYVNDLNVTECVIVGSTSYGSSAIYAQLGANIKIQACLIKDSTSYSVVINTSSHSIVSGCVSENSGAIYGYYSEFLNIYGNVLRGGASGYSNGVVFLGCENASIIGNVFNGRSYAVNLGSTANSHVTICGNAAYGNNNASLYIDANNHEIVLGDNAFFDSTESVISASATYQIANNDDWSEWISMEAIGTLYGSPTSTTLGLSGDAPRVYQFSASALQVVGLWMGTPDNHSEYHKMKCTFYWTVTVTGGNVRLYAKFYEAANNTNYAQTPTIYGDTVAAPVAYEIKTSEVFVDTSIFAPSLMNIQFGRDGASGDDTCTGDMLLLGVDVTFYV